jgi:hypothetical protein
VENLVYEDVDKGIELSILFRMAHTYGSSETKWKGWGCSNTVCMCCATDRPTSVLLCCRAVTGHDGARSCHWVMSSDNLFRHAISDIFTYLTAKTTLLHLDRYRLPSAWSHICVQKNLRNLIPCSLVDEHFAAPSTVTYFHALSSARQLLWTWVNGTRVPWGIVALLSSVAALNQCRVSSGPN